MKPKNDGPTQRSQAMIAVALIPDPEARVMRLTRILGKAQNPPPDGEADGSIDDQTFSALREVEKHAEQLARALAQARHLLKHPPLPLGGNNARRTSDPFVE